MSKHKERARAPELTVALIAAVFGLTGVLAGGLITYLTNRAVQNRVGVQQAREMRSARIAAAMENYRFSAVSNELSVMEQSRNDFSYERRYLTTQLSTADIATMLAHLGKAGSDAYAQSQFCLDNVGKIMSDHRAARPLDSDEVRSLQAQQACVNAGRKGLARLAR